jgi:hypothetical protein
VNFYQQHKQLFANFANGNKENIGAGTSANNGRAIAQKPRKKRLQISSAEEESTLSSEFTMNDTDYFQDDDEDSDYKVPKPIPIGHARRRLRRIQLPSDEDEDDDEESGEKEESEDDAEEETFEEESDGETGRSLLNHEVFAMI